MPQQVARRHVNSHFIKREHSAPITRLGTNQLIPFQNQPEARRPFWIARRLLCAIAANPLAHILCTPVRFSLLLERRIVETTETAEKAVAANARLWLLQYQNRHHLLTLTSSCMPAAQRSPNMQDSDLVPPKRPESNRADHESASLLFARPFPLRNLNLIEPPRSLGVIAVQLEIAADELALCPRVRLHIGSPIPQVHVLAEFIRVRMAAQEQQLQPQPLLVRRPQILSQLLSDSMGTGFVAAAVFCRHQPQLRQAVHQPCEHSDLLQQHMPGHAVQN